MAADVQASGEYTAEFGEAVAQIVTQSNLR